MLIFLLRSAGNFRRNSTTKKIDTTDEPTTEMKHSTEHAGNSTSTNQNNSMTLMDFFPPPPPEFSEPLSSSESSSDSSAVRNKLQLWETRSSSNNKLKPSLPLKPRSASTTTTTKHSPSTMDKTPVDEQEIVLPPSQEQLLADLRETLAVLASPNAPDVFDRCSSVAASCQAYLEMITPHARFKLREHLTNLQGAMEKLIGAKGVAIHAADLQAVLQGIVQTVSKWFSAKNKNNSAFFTVFFSSWRKKCNPFPKKLLLLDFWARKWVFLNWFLISTLSSSSLFCLLLNVLCVLWNVRHFVSSCIFSLFVVDFWACFLWRKWCCCLSLSDVKLAGWEPWSFRWNFLSSRSCFTPLLSRLFSSSILMQLSYFATAQAVCESVIFGCFFKSHSFFSLHPFYTRMEKRRCW